MTQSLTGRCPPAWMQQTRDEFLGAPTTQGHFTALVTKFGQLMANHRLVLPNVDVALNTVFGTVGVTDGGFDFYENITWNCGVTLGDGNAFDVPATILDMNTIERNLIHGPAEPLKEENAGNDVRDAPLVLELFANFVPSRNVIRDNNFARDAGDDNETVMACHQTSAGVTTKWAASSFNALGGNVSRNTGIDPQYVNAATGDFTVGSATLVALVSATPKTRAAIGARTPPE